MSKIRSFIILALLSIISGFTTSCVMYAPVALPDIVNGSLAIPVKIYYATDRQQTGEEDPNKYFGNTEKNTLTYGTLTVSIPKSHTRGTIERPKWYHVEISENPNKHMMLLHPITEKDAPSFFRELNQDINRTEQKEMFLFIHGFNNSFQDAALRTAQIAYDVGFVGQDSAGVPVMYSWASTEEMPPLGYTRDKTRVSHTRPHLSEFLAGLARDSGASKINIIAHSMGTDLLGQVINELAKIKDKPVFNQIILAAPDIDQEVFSRDIAPKMVRLSARTTVYTSSKDNALKASYEVNGARQVGDSTDGPIVVKGVETVDISKVDFGLVGHSTYADARPMLEDMFLMLVHGLPASKRNLHDAINGNGMKYWIVPK